MIFRKIVKVFWSCTLLTSANSVLSDDAIMPKKHLKVLEKYCFDCHDTDTQKGKLDLETLSFNMTKDIPTAEHWQNILDSINSGEMPPEKKKQISPEEKTALLRDLSIQMVRARDILSDNGGEITMRRMNRREYTNSMESLLGFKPDVRELPTDDGSFKFDTYGNSLFFSSDQFELYRKIAQVNLRTAMKGFKKKPKSEKKHIEPEFELIHTFLEVAKSNAEHLEKGQAFLRLPKSEQTIETAKKMGYDDVPHILKRFTNGPGGYARAADYLKRPEAATGAVMVHYNWKRTLKYNPVIIPADKNRAGGKYILRIRAGSYDYAPERERYLNYSFKAGKNQFHNKGFVKVEGTIEKPQIIEVEIEKDFGMTAPLEILHRMYDDYKSQKYAFEKAQKENGFGSQPAVWVDWVELEGPYFDEWPLKEQSSLILTQNDGESEEVYAKRMISGFATKAFRGQQPDQEFLKSLVWRYLSKSEGGKEKVDALVDVYSLVLASPDFIYICEPREGERTAEMDQREFAVRLSYFLWSSPPDQELLNLAKEGKLYDEGILSAQTTRLLTDARSNNFISGFTHQWLDMKRLDQFDFPAEFNPGFDDTIRESARQEVYQTIRYLLDNKQPMSKLLKADFVIVNNVMADYYGLSGVSGTDFSKVSVPESSPRGGLLGMAAIHLMGSDGLRTSPVERGSWVLRHLLDDPPPPAPANVPQLERLENEVLSTRQMLKAHQEEAQCAQCHQKIDPIGFAMENFTAAGLWRTQETIRVEEHVKGKKKLSYKNHTFDIDPSGKLPGGKDFSDYFGLRDAVAKREKAFAMGFSKALIAYSLGRPYNISDHNFATSVTNKAESQGNDLGSFLHALVQSKQFRSK
ncbi:MAG: DUF1592 domain-containing protein [Lentisphaeraceae bacterium]|nr:DUF1592 domain-containing protein [Lentisphaeraceae bacterium]